MSNIKKKHKASRFPQTKVSSACVSSEKRNALPRKVGRKSKQKSAAGASPHKGGRQAANKKPSVSDSFLEQAPSGAYEM